MYYYSPCWCNFASILDHLILILIVYAFKNVQIIFVIYPFCFHYRIRKEQHIFSWRTHNYSSLYIISRMNIYCFVSIRVEKSTTFYCHVFLENIQLFLIDYFFKNQYILGFLVQIIFCILHHIYPLGVLFHWELEKKHKTAHILDPHFIWTTQSKSTLFIFSKINIHCSSNYCLRFFN